MPSKKNESNYILCKFSKFIEEIHLKKGSFRAILVPKTKEDIKVDTYYVYPTLDVLEIGKRKIVMGKLNEFIENGENPKDSIGFSGVICQEKNTWEDQIVSNYKFITPINIDQIPRLGYTVSKKEKHEASSNNMPIEINKYYIWNTLADLSLGKVHYIYILKKQKKKV